MVNTYSPKLSEIKSEWRLLDAEGQVLGRFASHIAQILRGKENPAYVPNLPCGDFVIVVNASKIVVTGAKLVDKKYYRHSGYPHGLKIVGLTEMLAKQPTRVIEHAVKGMLPKGPLGRELMRRLKVYAGPEHPHKAQSPLMES